MEQEQIKARIEELENRLKNVEGSVCEVWARIVGYYQNVKGWNNGKTEERKERVMFDETVKK